MKENGGGKAVQIVRYYKQALQSTIKKKVFRVLVHVAADA